MSSSAADELSKKIMAMPSMDPLMFGATLAQFGICSTGLVINGFLVYTILRNKQLRSTSCFRFILALVISDCIGEFLVATVPTVLTLTNTPIPLLICFYVITYAAIATQHTMVLMLLISLDRLCSIIKPINYKNTMDRHLRKYVSIMLTISATTACFPHIYLSYPYAQMEAEKRIFCMPTDTAGPVATAFGLYMWLFLNSATILVYLSIWLMVKCKIIKLAQSSVEAGLLRSMHVLIAVTFFCYLLPVPIRTNWMLSRLQLSPTSQNVLSRILQQLTKIAQAVNGLVLYVCSSEYRLAIQKELGRIFGMEWTNNNRVINISSSSNAQQQWDNGGSVLHLNPQQH